MRPGMSPAPTDPHACASEVGAKRRSLIAKQCVRACMRACVRACVRACERASVRAHLCLMSGVRMAQVCVRARVCKGVCEDSLARSGNRTLYAAPISFCSASAGGSKTRSWSTIAAVHMLTGAFAEFTTTDCTHSGCRMARCSERGYSRALRHVNQNLWRFAVRAHTSQTFSAALHLCA
jgi:hypothetical protein